MRISSIDASDRWTVGCMVYCQNEQSERHPDGHNHRSRGEGEARATFLVSCFPRTGERLLALDRKPYRVRLRPHELREKFAPQVAQGCLGTHERIDPEWDAGIASMRQPAMLQPCTPIPRHARGQHEGHAPKETGCRAADSPRREAPQHEVRCADCLGDRQRFSTSAPGSRAVWDLNEDRIPAAEGRDLEGVGS